MGEKLLNYTAAWSAQLEERRSEEQWVTGSNSGQTKNNGL